MGNWAHLKREEVKLAEVLHVHIDAFFLVLALKSQKKIIPGYIAKHHIWNS
jgi:hypothetical protein